MNLMHDALLYDTDERFVDVLAPFVADGLAAAQQVCVVTRQHNTELLRDALGTDARQVQFIDAIDWYQYPARTIAGYHRTIQTARKAGAPGLRVVGEVEFGTTEAEHAAWTRYESILNAVFVTEPAWIVCPYDQRRLPDKILEHAHHTHTHQVEPGQRHHSHRYTEPQTFVGPLPLHLAGDPLTDLELNGSLRPVRAAVDQIAADAGLPSNRTAELLVAVNEIATNALIHGQPPARLLACGDDRTLTFQVTDTGTEALDPLAGFRPPPTRAIGGAGLWIARQLADQLEITCGPEGTTVRLSVTL